MNKTELRQHIRCAKGSHSGIQLQEMSAAICQRLLSHPRIISANTILAYWPLPDEVDITPLINQLHLQGKRILLPKVISQTEMTIHPYLGPSSLRVGAYGILEPTTPALSLSTSGCDDGISDSNIHDDILALIPGIAFDASCHRLGRGKGYYDHFLSSHTYIYKVGVCYPFQLLPAIPAAAHDVLMDEII